MLRLKYGCVAVLIVGVVAATLLLDKKWLSEYYDNHIGATWRNHCLMTASESALGDMRARWLGNGTIGAEGSAVHKADAVDPGVAFAQGSACGAGGATPRYSRDPVLCSLLLPPAPVRLDVP